MSYYTFVYIYLLLFFPNGNKSCAPIPRKCLNTKYRSFDGSCNNLEHPNWGTPNIPFRRLLAPVYGDGISSYRKTKGGKELPNARKISERIYPDVDAKDPKFTLSFMQFGQIITHDMGLVLTDQFQFNCCTEDLQFLDKMPSPKCDPIVIPRDDPYYSIHNARCISFARIFTDRDHSCGENDKPVEQLTAVNSFLDLSIIYGNKNEINNHMRLYKYGLLKTTKAKHQEWPLQSLHPSAECPFQKGNKTCFYTSDIRINQNPQLTLLHIIFYREHNRLAKELSTINPHWDDETLFQEARKINIAQYQWICYYEWLPLLLSKKKLLLNNIIYADPTTFIDDYDPEVDPTILNEHNNAAFRIHTQIAGRLDLVEEDRSCHETFRLSDWYLRPYVLQEDHYFSKLARGLTTQSSLATDEYHDQEISRFWFRRGKLGYDLKAIDIQRGRDVGLSTYKKVRALCNLPQQKYFDEMTDIPDDLLEKLEELYDSPEDVDLIVGGSLEYPLPDALLGPTFHCILLEQFWRTRVGDRFWFERSGNTGFTLNQLNNIRKNTRLSRLICDNSDDIAKMQLKAFEHLDSRNSLGPCSSLPTVNLTLWKN